MLGLTGQLRATLVASTGTTVALLVGLLVVLGVAMIAVAVWLVRSTRADHPSLAPLETMGDRSFRRASSDLQATRLAAARPHGAPGPAPIVPLDDEPETAPAGEPAEARDQEVAGPAPAESNDAAEESDAAENGESTQQESASTGHTSETEQQTDAP